MAALRLKSEFEQFSGARKSAQRQDAWQSVIPGTPSIASSFPHLPPKTPEPANLQNREMKNSKDEDNEENSKIAKTKKEPGTIRISISSLSLFRLVLNRNEQLFRSEAIQMSDLRRTVQPASQFEDASEDSFWRETLQMRHMLG